MAPGARNADSEPNDWLVGGGACGALVRALDGSRTPLGPRSSWPHALSNALVVALESERAMCILWGAEWTLLYNDAFRALSGLEAIGRPAKAVWGEAWMSSPDAFEAAILRGESPRIDARRARISSAWEGGPHELAFRPLRGDGGTIDGALLTVRARPAPAAAVGARSLGEGVLHAAFGDAAIGLAITRPDGRFVDANPAYRALGGYSLEDLSGRRAWDLVHPDDRGENAREVGRMLAGEIPSFQLEDRYLRRDGKGTWVRRSVSLVRDGAGEPRWIASIVEDISSRRRADRILKAARDRETYFLALADELSGLHAPVDILGAAARLLRERLQADRCASASFLEGEDACVHVVPRGAPGVFVRQMDVRLAGDPILEALARAEELSIDDVALAPDLTERARSALAVLGIGALMATSRCEQGRLAAVFVVHSARPRAWSGLERSLLRETALRTWSALGQARAETELRARERLLAESQRIGHIGSWEWHLDSGALRWSDQQYALFGHEPGSFVPSVATFAAAVPADERARVQRLLIELAAAGEPFEVEHPVLGPDGRRRVLWSKGRVSVRDADGRPRVMAGVSQDVTARSAGELALRESEQRYAPLFHDSPVATTLTRLSDGVRIGANAAFARLYELAPDELVGQSSVAQGLVDADFAAKYQRAVETEGALRGVEREVRTRSGRPITVIFDAVRLRVGDESFGLTTVRDVTAQRSAEATLRRRTRQLERLSAQLTIAESRARERLAKTLHDGIQQLLFAATLKLDRAARRGAGDVERIKELITEAHADLDEAVAAARSLAVEIFPRALHDAGLAPAIEWLVGWMLTKYGLVVEATVDRDVDPLREDVRTLLFESLRELLFNAVKHAGVQRVSLELRADPEGLRATVTDLGCGFDPASLNERLEVNPVGLGLLSIRERLLLMGGTFEIESAPGRGSSFRLRLPRNGPSEETKS